jgi:hypothetical protein
MDDGRETEEKFSAKETKRRMEAALRGAKIAGHKAMSEIAPKRNKRTKKKDAGAGKPQRHST